MHNPIKSRQEAPHSASPSAGMDANIFNFPSKPVHPNQTLHPGLGITRIEEIKGLSEAEINEIITKKAYQLSLEIIKESIEELEIEVQEMETIESCLQSSIGSNIDYFRPLISNQESVTIFILDSYFDLQFSPLKIYQK